MPISWWTLDRNRAPRAAFSRLLRFHPGKEALMAPIPSPQSRDFEPGQLLSDLERRQDDALKQLDDLENQLNEVLQGLGITALADDELDLA